MRENELDHEAIGLVKIWTPAILLTILVMVVAMIPNGQLGVHFGNIPRSITDGGHLVGFVIYGMAIYYTISVRSGHFITDLGATIIANTIIVSLAIISETSQNFVNRTPELADVMLDVAGGFFGIAISMVCVSKKRRKFFLRKAAGWT